MHPLIENLFKAPEPPDPETGDGALRGSIRMRLGARMSRLDMLRRGPERELYELDQKLREEPERQHLDDVADNLARQTDLHAWLRDYSAEYVRLTTLEAMLPALGHDGLIYLLGALEVDGRSDYMNRLTCPATPAYVPGGEDPRFPGTMGDILAGGCPCCERGCCACPGPQGPPGPHGVSGPPGPPGPRRESRRRKATQP